MTLMITVALNVKTPAGESVIEYGISDTSINAEPDDASEECAVAIKKLRAMGEDAVKIACARLEEFKVVADRLI